MLGTITKPTTLGTTSTSLLVRATFLITCTWWRACLANLALHFPGLNEVDYSHYPDRAFQLQWLRSYLEAYKELKGQAGDVSDREVEIIYVQVNRFALVSVALKPIRVNFFLVFSPLNCLGPFCPDDARE